MVTNKDITKLSMVELKALAYDTMAMIQVQQKNLETIYAQMDKVEKETSKEEVAVEEVVEEVVDPKAGVAD